MLTYDELLPRLVNSKDQGGFRSLYPKKSYELYRAAVTRKATSGEDFRIAVTSVIGAIVIIFEQTGRNGDITSFPYATLTDVEHATDTYKYVTLNGDSGVVFVVGPRRVFGAHFDLVAPVVAAGLAQRCHGGGWISVEPGVVRAGLVSTQYGKGPHEEAGRAFTEAARKLGIRTERY